MLCLGLTYSSIQAVTVYSTCGVEIYSAVLFKSSSQCNLNKQFRKIMVPTTGFSFV